MSQYFNWKEYGTEIITGGPREYATEAKPYVSAKPTRNRNEYARNYYYARREELNAKAAQRYHDNKRAKDIGTAKKAA